MENRIHAYFFLIVCIFYGFLKTPPPLFLDFFFSHQDILLFSFHFCEHFEVPSHIEALYHCQILSLVVSLCPITRAVVFHLHVQQTIGKRSDLHSYLYWISLTLCINE